MWRGKPLFIKHRTNKEIDEAQNVNISDLPHPEKDEDRVKKPKVFSFNRGLYTFSCVPASDKGEYKGWFVLVMVLIMIHLVE